MQQCYGHVEKAIFTIPAILLMPGTLAWQRPAIGYGCQYDETVEIVIYRVYFFVFVK